jgi:hypothetical protein
VTILVCYAKCSPCQLGEHPSEPHTWMESEDIEGDPDVAAPASPEDWAALAAAAPCACHCMRPTTTPKEHP